MNLQARLNSMKSEVDDVNTWAEEEYSKYFASYFKGEKELYERMKSNSDPITDQELEWVLTDLPLELFSVTEQLSKMKIAQEVIKISIKEKERKYISYAVEGSMTQKKEEAQALTMEDKLLVDIYDAIMDRVTKQMSFSKELIMSAKKIWDSRRSDGIPLPEVSLDKEVEVLPNYYGKGGN